MDRSTTWPQTCMWPPGLKHKVCFNYLPFESTWCVLLAIRNVVLLSLQFYPRSRLHKSSAVCKHFNNLWPKSWWHVSMKSLQCVLTSYKQRSSLTKAPVSWLCAAWLCMRNFHLLGKDPNLIRLFCADFCFLTNSMFPLESPFIREPDAIFAIACTNCSFS